MSVLVNFLLFFLPLIVVPFGPSQFEIPKVMIAILSIEALAVWFGFKRKSMSLTFPPLLLVLGGVLLGLTLFHLLFLQTPFTFLGNSFRGQGILLLWHLLLLSFLSSQLVYKRLSYKWYAGIFCATFVGSLLLGNTTGRSVGTLGEPNALASFVIFLWPFVFFAQDMGKYQRLIRCGVLLLSLSIIFLTGSRSGLIAFVIQWFFFLTFHYSHKLKLSLILSLLLLFLSYALPLITHTKYEDRGVIWHTALAAGWLHPLAGGGFGNTEVWLRQVITAQHNTLIGYYIDSSHNIFLDWWVQGGIIGLSLLLGLVFWVIRTFSLKQDAFGLVLMLGLITVLSFNPVSIVTLVEFWWLLGQGFSNSLPSHKL